MPTTNTSKGWTPDDITDIFTVRQYLTSLIIGDGLGMAFHPEDDFRDYVNDDGAPVNGRDMEVVQGVLEREGANVNKDGERVNLVPTSGLPMYSEEQVLVIEACFDKCNDVLPVTPGGDEREWNVFTVSADIWFACGLTDMDQWVTSLLKGLRIDAG